ncbi:cytochrome P450 [Kitasatospora sp. NPDC091257]|uniref:cytochrome P450 n=1 Tax=Kitasatospora sp. NPDC091257 TaxID=3364084 RepID=UPI003827D371
MAAPVAPGRFPLLGHLPQLAVQRVEFLQSVRARGDIVRIFLGNRPVFVLNSPEAVHDVLLKQSRKFGKGLLFDVARPFIGNGIITSERDFHLRQRRALQPAFHRDSIAASVDTMTDIAEEQVSSWRPGQVIAMDLVLRRRATPSQPRQRSSPRTRRPRPSTRRRTSAGCARRTACRGCA